MRPKYKNEIFSYLITNNWDIIDFIVKEFDGNLRIYYKNTPLYFEFKATNSYDNYWISYTCYSPNWDVKTEYRYTWPRAILIFNNWLESEVKIYIEDQNTIDLWEEYMKSSKAVCSKNINFDSQENFTTEEQRQLQLSINELKGLIIDKFQLQEEQQEIINTRLDYLIEATSRLNRFDWKGTVINTIISLIIALSFDAEKANQLVKLFQIVFHGIKDMLLPN